jgi:hypothetical protein
MQIRTLACLLLATIGLEGGLWALKTVQQPRSAKESQEPSQGAPAHEAKPNHIFSDMIPTLLQKTLVPLRLPEYVPYSDDKETPLYSILEVAEPENYSIQLAWLPDCEGGNACHVGYVGGTKKPPNRSEETEVPVTLSGGIKGSFVDSDCSGTHCDDASLYWTEGGYYYGISLKAGNKKTLVRMANSAIAPAGKQRKGSF